MNHNLSHVCHRADKITLTVNKRVVNALLTVLIEYYPTMVKPSMPKAFPLYCFNGVIDIYAYSRQLLCVHYNLEMAQSSNIQDKSYRMRSNLYVVHCMCSLVDIWKLKCRPIDALPALASNRSNIWPNVKWRVLFTNLPNLHTFTWMYVLVIDYIDTYFSFKT